MSLPSFTRDTTDLLSKLDGLVVEENTLLGGIDVEALYSSIPHDQGLKALSYYLSSRGTYMQSHNAFVLKLMEYILVHNYFLFDGRHYHQLKGTAMGSPCAPTYANIFLGWWEATMAFVGDREKYLDLVPFWTRYIDDVLVLWTGTACEFKQFIESINQNDLGLTFTFTLDPSSLDFLDVTIVKDALGGLITRVFRKATATNSLLRWESCHPGPLKRGIPKGQYLRLRRNCTQEREFLRQAGDLRSRFRDRGYPDRVLIPAFKHAKATPRQQLLVPKKHPETAPLCRVIGTFDNMSGPIREILQRHWGILQMDKDLRTFVGDYPQITYRKGKSIGDMVTHSHLAPLPPPSTWLDRSNITGSHKCGHCRACPFMKKTESVTITISNKLFKIKDFINCSTRAVVYVAVCSCALMYVGKTIRELRRRVLEHIGDIRNKRDTALARHVNEIHGGDTKGMTFFGIEKMNPSSRGGDLDKLLLQREARWIFNLETVTPKGLNELLCYGSFL
ncbi:uncharacterized protein LOC130274454 [Hyla sarda]|uniref:uncharacterized protein LOC130274454 n=1 Tax=Hyla sarda TaxID=327740 RepID=UPI0024C2EA2E|nr:uncharacterized protein LOC130274454 [Hyla sarda]